MTHEPRFSRFFVATFVADFVVPADFSCQLFRISPFPVLTFAPFPSFVETFVAPPISAFQRFSFFLAPLQPSAFSLTHYPYIPPPG
jgi:hypothetical protein